MTPIFETAGKFYFPLCDQDGHETDEVSQPFDTHAAALAAYEAHIRELA